MGTKISAMTAATSAGNDDVLPLVQSAASKKVAVSTLRQLAITDDTGTARTLALTDAGRYIRMDNGSANTVTVPPNSSVAFPVGTQVTVVQAGTGQTTIAEGSGVTVNTPETLKLRVQYSVATLIKVATDEWDLMGDLETV